MIVYIIAVSVIHGFAMATICNKYSSNWILLAQVKENKSTQIPKSLKKCFSKNYDNYLLLQKYVVTNKSSAPKISYLSKQNHL